MGIWYHNFLITLSSGDELEVSVFVTSLISRAGFYNG